MPHTAHLQSWQQTRSKTQRRSWVTSFQLGRKCAGKATTTAWEGTATKYAPKENYKNTSYLDKSKNVLCKDRQILSLPAGVHSTFKNFNFLRFNFQITLLLFLFSFSFLLRRYPNIKTDNVSLKQRYKPLISFQNIYNVIFCLFEDFYLQMCFPLWVWMN